MIVEYIYNNKTALIESRLPLEEIKKMIETRYPGAVITAVGYFRNK